MIDEGPIFAGMDVTQVAYDVHGFVISDQSDHCPTGARRLALQAHEMADDLRRVRPSVGDVAGLDEDISAAHPAIMTIDQRRGPEDAAIGLEIAVQIADRDDPVHRPGHGLRQGWGRWQQGGQQARPERDEPDQRAACHPKVSRRSAGKGQGKWGT